MTSLLLVIAGIILGYFIIVVFGLRFFRNVADHDELGARLQEEKWRFYHPPTDKK